MTKEKQIIAMAELEGYVREATRRIWELTYDGHTDYNTFDELPNYLEDLNAVHRVEASLAHQEHADFREKLWEVVNASAQLSDLSPTALYVSASAAQRTEAILRTKGKWEVLRVRKSNPQPSTPDKLRQLIRRGLHTLANLGDDSPKFATVELAFSEEDYARFSAELRNGPGPEDEDLYDAVAQYRLDHPEIPRSGGYTDTERLDWLIAGGYCPAQWREPTVADLGRPVVLHPNGLINVGPGNRQTIDAAITRSRQSAKPNET